MMDYSTSVILLYNHLKIFPQALLCDLQIEKKKHYSCKIKSNTWVEMFRQV